MKARVRVSGSHVEGQPVEFSAEVPAHGHVVQQASVTLPARAGAWQLEAELETKVAGVTHPIVSSWEVRTLAPTLPTELAQMRVGVSEQDGARKFVAQNGLVVTGSMIRRRTCCRRVHDRGRS